MTSEFLNVFFFSRLSVSGQASRVFFSVVSAEFHRKILPLKTELLELSSKKHAQIPSFWSLDWTRFSRVFKRSWLGNPTSRRAIKKGTLKFGRVKFVSHQQPHLGTVKCPVDRVQPRHYQFMMWTIWIVTFAGHKLKDLTICDLSKWTTHTQVATVTYLFWDPGIRNPVARPTGIAMLEPKSALARPQSRSSSKKVTLELKDGEASWRNLKWNF